MVVVRNATAVGKEMTAMTEKLGSQDQYEIKDKTWHCDHECHMLGTSHDTVHDLHVVGKGSDYLCCCWSDTADFRELGGCGFASMIECQLHLPPWVLGEEFLHKGS